MKLSKAEEHVMNYLWKLENAFMKDLLEAFDEPKPATTTVATLLKRMHEKGFIGYTTIGKARQYYPLVKKEFLNENFRKDLKKRLINNFYDYCFVGVKHDIFFQLGFSFFEKKCKKNHYIYDFKEVFKNQ